MHGLMYVDLRLQE